MSSSTTQASSSDTINDRAPAVRATMREIFLSKGDTFRQNAHEQATKYYLLPTAAPVNRVLIAGTVVSISDANNDPESSPYWRAEFTNGNGDSLFVYAGDNSGHHDDGSPQAFFGSHSSPLFAAAVCKLDFIDDPRETAVENRTVVLRPEAVTEISRDRRDQILINNALATIDRATSHEYPKLESRVEQQYADVDERFDRTDFKQDALDVIKTIDSQRQ